MIGEQVTTPEVRLEGSLIIGTYVMPSVVEVRLESSLIIGTCVMPSVVEVRI